ncbi:MAG: nodulation protein NfeD, partial [Elusimicrobia bacterium]|nr:nodulation protein NfeD [Elusimicrobiota bacterium]
KEKKDTMEEKVLNDASAYMKSIAQERKRNVSWAVKAVTKSSSISAEEALKANAVDYMAENLDELLKKIDGKEIPKLGKLRVKNAEKVVFPLTKRQKLLSAISDPNVAMILMSLGAAGLFIELYNPGLVLPGVVGAMALVTAFYSFHTLSANIAGVALMLLAFVFFIAEIKIASYGLLTVAGVASFLLGSLMLFNTSSAMGIAVSHSVIASMTGGVLAVTGIISWIVFKAQRRKVVTGIESLKGKRGIAKTALSPTGTVLVEGELWDAVAIENIAQGRPVLVEEVDGFKLKVKQI